MTDIDTTGATEKTVQREYRLLMKQTLQALSGELHPSSSVPKS
jgi:hypothetical protein